jgi:hypothetical protein
MKAGRTKVLIVGSHPNSGFSMLNFSRDNFAALKSIDTDIELLFAKPLQVFSKILPRFILRKYFAYLDKFILFGPYLTILVLVKRVNIVHVLDQGDAIYRFFVKGNCKFIVTVHDLFAIQASKGKIPDVVTAYPGKVYQKLISIGLAKASLALAISASTERDVKTLFPRLPTQVIHNFLNNENFELPAFEQVNKSDKFFLILMNAHWRKDRLNSIGVWKTLCQLQEFKDSSLVIVGNQLTNDERSLISDSLIARVSVFENLATNEIANLYRRCTGVINISKYEGFGLPIIEANIFGRICIYGGSVAFQEIAGQTNIDWDKTMRNPISEDFSEMIVSPEQRKMSYEYVLQNFSVRKYTDSVCAVYLNL